MLNSTQFKGWTIFCFIGFAVATSIGYWIYSIWLMDVPSPLILFLVAIPSFVFSTKVENSHQLASADEPLLRRDIYLYVLAQIMYWVIFWYCLQSGGKAGLGIAILAFIVIAAPLGKSLFAVDRNDHNDKDQIQSYKRFFSINLALIIGVLLYQYKDLFASPAPIIFFGINFWYAAPIGLFIVVLCEAAGEIIAARVEKKINSKRISINNEYIFSGRKRPSSEVAILIMTIKYSVIFVCFSFILFLSTSVFDSCSYKSFDKSLMFNAFIVTVIGLLAGTLGIAYRQFVIVNYLQRLDLKAESFHYIFGIRPLVYHIVGVAVVILGGTKAGELFINSTNGKLPGNLTTDFYSKSGLIIILFVYVLQMRSFWRSGFYSKDHHQFSHKQGFRIDGILMAIFRVMTMAGATIVFSYLLVLAVLFSTRIFRMSC